MTAPAPLSGRRALITGGGNGIGAEVARRFAALGARGVVLDLPGAAEPAPGWTALPADVRDEDSVRHAVTEAVRLLGGLDVVVAAAGVVPSWQQPAELDLADFDRVQAINVRGVAATIKHTAPVLGADGAIVAVASLNSWRGDPNLTSYAASKHAVLGIVRSAALALGPAGVRVNAVAPGPIATEALRARMSARAAGGGPAVDDALTAAAAGTALRRIATAAEVAEVIAFLAGPASSAVTGALIPVDGGIL
jgi:NAD(P)-dependent dehydrogenase (short-subunit alcohol dehydrogenase family)